MAGGEGERDSSESGEHDREEAGALVNGEESPGSLIVTAIVNVGVGVGSIVGVPMVWEASRSTGCCRSRRKLACREFQGFVACYCHKSIVEGIYSYNNVDVDGWLRRAIDVGVVKSARAARIMMLPSEVEVEIARSG